MKFNLLTNGTPRTTVFTLLALIALIVFGVSKTSLWTETEARAYDLLSTLGAPLPDEPGLTIIAIDEPSLEAVGAQWPWPRSTHARLIERLREAGVRAIAFDVVFAEPTEPTEDQAFAAALGPDVVLAADESLIERPYGAMLTRTEPMPEFVQAGARFGIASLEMDSDGVLRTLPSYPDGFMTRLLEAAGATQRQEVGADRKIQYFGIPGSYPTISYYQALDPDEYLPPDYLKGRVVIVGLALQTNADVSRGAVDAFETSYSFQSKLLSPGVEVQATIYDNLRTGAAVDVAPNWLGPVLIAFGAVLALLLSRPHAPWRKIILLLGALFLFALASWWLLRFGRIWLPTLGPAGAATVGVLVLAARDFAKEQAQRKEVEQAFGQYLAPEMIRKIAKDPSLLNLGGESREMTILFSDIRGFTAIAEAMKDDPQGLTRLINTILTPLSNIIIENGGTIDKYMGDCVMAFWNAPLDDPDHADHALRAATSMLAAMDEINTKVQSMLPDAAQVPRIKMGIGINTGICVVGNMGSDRRFDYSVLGDTVNIASRLEGQCKEFQSDILIGSGTVGQSRDFRFREVAKIQVKGREASEQVYTLI